MRYEFRYKSNGYYLRLNSATGQIEFYDGIHNLREIKINYSSRNELEKGLQKSIGLSSKRAEELGLPEAKERRISERFFCSGIKEIARTKKV